MNPETAWIWQYDNGMYCCLIFFSEKEARKIHGKDGPKRGKLLRVKLTEIK